MTLPPTPPSTTGVPAASTAQLPTAPPASLPPSLPPHRTHRDAGRDNRPRAGRCTNGRGGHFLEGDRAVPAPKATIAKINVNKPKHISWKEHNRDAGTPLN